MYDEAGHIVGEYSSTGALVEETVWLGDLPVATIRPKTGGVDVYYVHTDHLGTPRKVTRPSDDKMRWRWDSRPFGDTAPDENPESLGIFIYNLRMPGQIYSSETGLSYNYFRDGYDSTTGAFTQADPMGLAGGTSLYTYAVGNPISMLDPLGLCPWCLVIPGVCAYGGCEGLAAALGLGAYLSTPTGQKAAQNAVASVPEALKCCTSYTDVYEPYDEKHGSVPRMGPKGIISAAPANGQIALANSAQVGRERIGHDPSTGQVVIFRNHRTDETNCIKYWHGYVVSQTDFTPQQWRAGRDAGFPDWPRKPR